MGSFIEKTYWLRANMLKQYFTGLALVKAKFGVFKWVESVHLEVLYFFIRLQKV